MNNEEQDTSPPPYPPYVIRSCELNGISNKEQDTHPQPTHCMSLGVVS